ncbi:MAG: hypothetical protein WAU68_01885 [Vitreimonas sp.]
MKNRLFAAALAAVTLAGVALPAAAQDFRGDGRGDYNQNQDFRGDRGSDWRMRGQITVRQDGRQFSFDRQDRAFYRLSARPFNFRPGLTYVYTDRCSRGFCMVLAFSPRSRTPVDRTWAPRLDRGFFFANGDRDGRFDGRGDGRWDNRGDDGRFNGDRDNRGDDRGNGGYPR